MAGISLADRNVAALLAKIGFTEDQARDLGPDDIYGLGLSPAESILLRKAITNAQALYSKYFPLVGRVGCEWLAQDGSNKILQGSCVLCGKAGLVVTVLHTVQPPDNSNARNVRLRVTLPNTRKGRFSFGARILKFDKNADLAVLQPVKPNPRLEDIDFFSEWAQTAPRIPSKVHLISYPGILDKEFPGRLLRGDRPSMHSGRVVHKEDSEAISTYPCFSGCSGGLVLCFDTDGTPGCGIHLGQVHETEELSSLNLTEVNEGLQQKGGFGHFSHGVANFIQGPKPTLYERKKRSATYLVRTMKPEPQSPIDDRRVSSRRTLVKGIQRIVKSCEDYEAPKSSAEFDLFEMVDYVASPEAYEKEKTSKKREASTVDDAALNEGKKAKSTRRHTRTYTLAVHEVPQPPSHEDATDALVSHAPVEDNRSALVDNAPSHQEPVVGRLEKQPPAVKEESFEGATKMSYTSILREASGGSFTTRQGGPPRKPTPAQAVPVAPITVSPQATLAFSSSAAEDTVADGGDGYSVYVKNLPLSISQEDLETEFQKFGSVKPGGVNLRNQKQGVCFAFIQFEDSSSVQSAIEASPISIGGRQVYVEEKKPTSIGPSAGRGRAVSGRSYQADGMNARGNFGGRNFGRGGYNSERDFNSRGRGGRANNYRSNGDSINGFRRGDTNVGNGSCPPRRN